MRVSALAACLLAANPTWRAPQLKAAIFAMSDTNGAVRPRDVAQGVLPDPVARRRGACPALRTNVARLQSLPVSAEEATVRNQLVVTMAILEGSGWMPDEAVAVARRAREILAQCDVGLSVQGIEVLAVPKRFQYFHRRLAGVLVREAALPKPTVFLVKDTLDQPAFEAQTFGLANTGSMPLLRDTLWMTRPVAHPGIALAHEIVHLLTNSGRHVVLVDNLMQARTAPQNVKLTAAQCKRMVDTARKRGLLRNTS